MGMGMSMELASWTLGVDESLANDVLSVLDDVDSGGCSDQFLKAIEECYQTFVQQNRDEDDPTTCKRAVVDAEACVRATAALRSCFAAGGGKFNNHKYLGRIDEGLDEDLKPSPERMEEEFETRFRWWTGMKRSS